jgi:hypothetical protein
MGLPACIAHKQDPSWKAPGRTEIVHVQIEGKRRAEKNVIKPERATGRRKAG